MKLKSTVVFRAEFDGTGMLLNMADGAVFHLNTNSCLICKCLEKGTDVDEILSQIKNTFNDVPETARTDVETFLGKMREKGMLED